MPYPLIIKDDFFSDPDSISRMTKEINYSVSKNSWPGKRSIFLSEINLKLFLYATQKIFLLFHDQIPNHNMAMTFHKSQPFVEGDKWHKKNRGWIHKDGCLFGGLIYLDKNPDKDAGTTIYKSKDGYDVQTHESIAIKEDHFSGKEIDDKKFNKAFDVIEDQYEETLRIPNLYNRLVLIPGDQPHSMTTIGDKERNTLLFFCYDLTGVSLPEYKRYPTVPISNHAL